MGNALPHKTGGFRAYKKIGGREFQFYSKDKAEADIKQAEFGKLAALKPKQAFSTCGRLKGFRINLRKKKDRAPYIFVKKQVGKFRNQQTKEWVYSGRFEDEWGKIKTLWAEAHALLPSDLADYSARIRAAKRLYIKDVAVCEAELKTYRKNTG